ncbi:LytR/AlgR family response regulator transcription factor [Flavobacterium caeni]|uniref:Two component transcriptional regulator, LytTR family n=1 Tax=Flavobacterium caeni TaxID=490189 RepID=A0A1G5GBZ9_9FLAO|nr:LytTR family DNA-binding domain-containing protein [Flavobacterium caeni]SCY48278.1 two component transcriptional regulator, LytTR family [Flavobacterium caeni]
MATYNCIIIDDDEIDRITVVAFVKKFPELNIVGVFDNAASALPAIETQDVQILFLDIDMPGLSGIDFRKHAAHVPVCIFITAHPEHAVESFELDTLDFVVKPLKLDRFAQTVARIQDYLELKHKAQLFEASIGGDTIYIKEGHEQTKVKLHDILYLEALKDYTKIVTPQKRHCVLSSIGMLLKEDNFNSFIRVHRSYAVQKQFIKKILTNEVMLNNDVVIPVGRSYKDNLKTLQ